MSNDDPITREEWESCVVTFEQAKQELEELEARLATRHGVTGTTTEIRAQLIALAHADQIPEDELGREWFAALSWYSNYDEAEPTV